MNCVAMLPHQDAGQLALSEMGVCTPKPNLPDGVRTLIYYFWLEADGSAAAPDFPRRKIWGLSTNEYICRQQALDYNRPGALKEAYGP
jgi:hypothetical protein